MSGIEATCAMAMNTARNTFSWCGHHHMSLTAIGVAHNVERKSTEYSRKEGQWCQTPIRKEQLPVDPGKGCQQGNVASTGTNSTSMMVSEQQVIADSGSSLDLREGLRSKTRGKVKGNAHVAGDGLRRVRGASQESQYLMKEQERPSYSHTAAGHRSQQISQLNGKGTALYLLEFKNMELCFFFPYLYFPMFP